MADLERQAKDESGADADVSFEAIFGADAAERESEDIFLSATDETIAMLNSVFGGDQFAWENSFVWNMLSFG
ncbi:MAG: hypothetical protein M0R03_04020 [Novosphingobium sp.]|nr:hypothetical protein [Novosphingobium sp.]